MSRTIRNVLIKRPPLKEAAKQMNKLTKNKYQAFNDEKKHIVFKKNATN